MWVDQVGYAEVVSSPPLRAAASAFAFSSSFFFSFLVFFGLCVFSIYTGILLIQKKYLKGFNYSVFIQALQILSFVLLGYIFNFAIGIYVRLTIELTNDTIVGMDFGFVNWDLQRNANPDLIEMNFNIIAIILLSLIFKLNF